jgi:hypothetical protein
MLGYFGLLLSAPALFLVAEQTPKTAYPATGKAVVADDPDTIVVVAERLRSPVAGAIGPQVSLDSDAVAALGASNLADLLAQLAPLIGGSQGRGGGPLLLVNGRRIGSFDEVRNLAPEAIQRVDILPEEAALRLGYPATSKPVNIVLKPRYAAATGELEDRVTTRGLRNDFNTELNLVDIAGNNRMTLDLQYQIGEAITEAARGVVRPLDPRAASTDGIVSNPLGGALTPLPTEFAAVPAQGRGLADFAAGHPADDTAAYHTLVPTTHQFTANGTFARALPGAKAVSINAKFDQLTAAEWLGPTIAEIIAPVGGPSPFDESVRVRHSLPDLPVVTRQTSSDIYHLGAQLAGYGPWQWSAAVNWDRTDLSRHKRGGVDATMLQAAVDRGEIADPFAPPPALLLSPKNDSLSSSHDQLVAADLFASGPLFQLPAGDVALSLGSAFGRETIAATDPTGRTRLVRDHAGGQLSLDLPLMQKASAIGALDAGVSAAVDSYSDIGGIHDYGMTLNWKPDDSLSLLLAASRDQVVPSLSQRGAPLDTTPDAVFFDYTTGRSVIAARINGGDPALGSDRRSLLKAELGAKPLTGFTLTATYTALTDHGAIFAFPGITPAAELAVPMRIQRDAAGIVTAVDARSFNVARETRQELRLAFNFNRSFGKSGGLRVPGGGTFGGGHGFGASGRIIQFTLTDTIRLKDEVVLTGGAAPIDLVGDNELGELLRVPRHRIEAQLGAARDGVGLRANATWTSGGKAGAGSPGELHFAAHFFLNFRLFYFPASNAKLAAALPWLHGVRFLLAVDNLFDSYQRTTDAAGQTPLAYQRGLVDPLGRTVRFSIRKTID